MTTGLITMPSLEQAKKWYSATDPVHGFDHIQRVYHLAQRISRIEGADWRIVAAAALMHDVGGQQPVLISGAEPGDSGYSRASHQLQATEFANEILRSEGWNSKDIFAVQHCIRAHRFRDLSEHPNTLEAQVLFDADKLDAIGAVGVARAIAYAAKNGIPAYYPPSQYFLNTGQMEKDELHSAYHEYLFKLIKIRNRLYTTTARSLAEERHQTMVVYFEKLRAEILGEE